MLPKKITNLLYFGIKKNLKAGEKMRKSKMRKGGGDSTDTSYGSIC